MKHFISIARQLSFRSLFSWAVWGAVLTVLIFPGITEACPNCKEGLSATSQNLVVGYFWSILFMMSMPFLILGSLAGLFYWEVQRAKRKSSGQRIELSAARSFVRAGSAEG